MRSVSANRWGATGCGAESVGVSRVEGAAVVERVTNFILRSLLNPEPSKPDHGNSKKFQPIDDRPAERQRWPALANRRTAPPLQFRTFNQWYRAAKWEASESPPEYQSACPPLADLCFGSSLGVNFSSEVPFLPALPLRLSTHYSILIHYSLASGSMNRGESPGPRGRSSPIQIMSMVVQARKKAMV